MKKILIIGTNPLNFTKEFLMILNEKGNQVTVYSSYEPSFGIENITNKNGLEIKNIKLPTKLIDKIKVVFFGIFRSNILLIQIINGKIKNTRDFYNSCFISKYKKELKQFDIVNFQQLSLSALWIDYFRNDVKIISSFWGSDLFINESNHAYLNKVRFLRKSKYITLQNAEMKSKVIEKYGDNYAGKIKEILFPLKNNIFKYIDNQKDVSDKNVINIGIGYNAYERQNHLKIINSIIKLSNDYIKKIKLLLYFQYGGSVEYKKSILRIVKQNDLPYEVFEKMLAPKELAEKWKITNVMLMLPESDAFSASLSENLYAENIVVCGSWLPYSLYKKSNVYFEEIDGFDELTEKLIYIIDNYKFLKEKTKGNKERVTNTLDFEGNIKKWVDLF